MMVSNFIFEKSRRDQISKEVNELTKINHPAIQQFICFTLYKARFHQKPIIFSEYIEYRSLFDIISKERKGEHDKEWNMEKKMINIYGIASALLYLNSHKISHTTPNPKNILVEANYQPKLIEVGFYTQPKNSSFVSKSLSIASDETFFYLAPECLSDYKIESEKSDVYSYAIIVYEIITNDFPFDKSFNRLEWYSKMVKGAICPSFNKKVPKFFEVLLERCISHDIEEHPSFSEIIPLLERCISHDIEEADQSLITNEVNKENFDNYMNILINCK